MNKEQAQNRMELKFMPLSENEGFARVAVAAFMTQLDPTLEETEDVKTAVSEAVTNSIIHGYEKKEEGQQVIIEAYLTKKRIHIRIEDRGVGIENIGKAMEPLFTTKPELERSGMGFAFMEAFMDELYVESAPGKGTVVYMSKQIGGQ
ncbi:MAG: anti-sigma F factor [Lachnospiraceae bacterium]|nr:anti-sigma F factor [Lachnospiraceae bacterium]